MTPLAALELEYKTWQAIEGMSQPLGSADEHLCDQSLSLLQRAWLRQFCVRWDDAQREEDINEKGDKLAALLGMRCQNVNSQGRKLWQTDWGTKTGFGLIATLKRCIAAIDSGKDVP